MKYAPDGPFFPTRSIGCVKAEGKSMDVDKLQELIRILESSGLAELEIEEDGRRVRLSKQPAPIHVLTSHPVEQITTTPPPIGLSKQPPDTASMEQSGLVMINSPMVGTFYAAPTQGEPPFVLPGDTIEPEQTLCIVEAMKIMNTVVAKFPAIIEKVLAENAEPVEYNQPLFAVRPLI